jgi:membrane fusion protein (multidrug efflux system)
MREHEINEIPRPSDSAPPAAARRRLRRLVLLVVVPLAALLVTGLVYLHGGRYVETDNAYVKADKVPVSAEVSGTVTTVMVRENQTVVAGQPLFRLDRAPFDVAVAKAEAKLAQARTDLSALKESYREKEAEIALARTRYDFAVKEERRQADLVARHFISPARFDEAKQDAELAAQQIAALELDLKRLAASLGGGLDTPVEDQASYREAQAELAQARLDLQRTEVRAPLAGTVSNPPKPGQYVGAGATAMALVASGNLWIEANFPETDLTYVRPGQPVTVDVDTYPGVTWHGAVESLAPATGAEFSLIPPQNATGNWVKIVQRVPVRIRLQLAAGAPPLRAGLSTTVTIDTGHRRHFLGLTV